MLFHAILLLLHAKSGAREWHVYGSWRRWDAIIRSATLPICALGQIAGLQDSFPALERRTSAFSASASPVGLQPRDRAGGAPAVTPTPAAERLRMIALPEPRLNSLPSTAAIFCERIESFLLLPAWESVKGLLTGSAKSSGLP